MCVGQKCGTPAEHGLKHCPFVNGTECSGRGVSLLTFFPFISLHIVLTFFQSYGNQMDILVKLCVIVHFIF